MCCALVVTRWGVSFCPVRGLMLGVVGCGKFVVRWVVVENITVYSENFYLPISHIMIWGLGRTSNRVQYDFTDNDRDFWLLNEL